MKMVQTIADATSAAAALAASCGEKMGPRLRGSALFATRYVSLRSIFKCAKLDGHYQLPSDLNELAGDPLKQRKSGENNCRSKDLRRSKPASGECDRLVPEQVHPLPHGHPSHSGGYSRATAHNRLLAKYNGSSSVLSPAGCGTRDRRPRSHKFDRSLAFGRRSWRSPV
jgi:hypothetical protein